MATLTYRSPPDRRYAALALTALAHVLLLLAWQATRRLPAPDANRDTRRIQWIDLAPRTPAHRRPAAPAPEQARERTRERLPAPVRMLPAPFAITVPAPPIVAAPPAPPAAPATSAQSAATTPAPALVPERGPLLQRALRDAGAVDRALRKENNPYIVAPPDSPQIRMRRDMEAAHAMAPPAWYEAPKVDELVNNTGDGARRTRMITGNGTMCETDRGPNTSIDMIEKHGKRRFTNCPEHESPASSQEWKTARDP
jgi:hypothetical protein